MINCSGEKGASGAEKFRTGVLEVGSCLGEFYTHNLAVLERNHRAKVAIGDCFHRCNSEPCGQHPIQ